METRTITQYHIYGLLLNDMRGCYENQHLVALASSREALADYLRMNRVEPYYDENGGVDDYGNSHSYYKVFAKGSPLEWYNGFEHNGNIIDEWLTEEKFADLRSRYTFIG